MQNTGINPSVRRRRLLPAVLASVFLALLAAVTAVAALTSAPNTARVVIPRHEGMAGAHREVATTGSNGLLPRTGVLLGAWVQPTGGFSNSAMESSIVAFEHLIGHKLALDSIYTAWGEPMPVALSEWDLKAGRIPVISWGRVSSASVLAGQYDSQIRADARQLRSLRGPVLLRYFPEMNNHFLRKPAGRPAVYVAAWRKVYRMFRASGASNVQWVWCPSAIAFSSTTAQRFYPGRAYVNWICADGYNWAPTRPHSSWRSFAQIFTPFYQWAKDKSQPLLIGEVGTDEGKPGAKAHWLRQMAAELVTEFPRIRAIVYFDSRHQNFGLWFNWKINSSPSALDAFRVIARENYFSAHPTLGKTARNPR